MTGIPVFIITCVVARLTFFLKPFHDSCQLGIRDIGADLKRRSTVPAQDMTNGERNFVMRMSRRLDGLVGHELFDDVS